MYTLRPFRRMNSVTRDEIERFVKAVAGKRLSVRDIELLADGYFRGPAALREAIESGKLGWSLEQMKSVPEDLEGCSEFERVLLNDLEILRKSMQRAIIRQQGATPQTPRQDKIQIDPELLRRLCHECDGWMQRIHEKLVEEEKIQVSYPTLTRLLRELGLGKSPPVRCDRVPDEPGAEMQHDTTVYTVQLSGGPTRVIASLLYLRYSKRLPRDPPRESQGR